MLFRSPNNLPKKFREFIPQYAQAKDPDIVKNHQKLYEDAYNNRDTLQSGNEELTDQDLDEAFLEKDVVITLDFVGLGNLEAAFPLQIDLFEDLCEDIARMSLSDKNRRLLSAKLTPTHCEEYLEMESRLKDLKQQLGQLLGSENIQKINEIKAEKAKLDEQIKELQGRAALLNKDSEEAAALKQQIKELSKQSKVLGGKIQGVYMTCENSNEVKDMMKQISTLTKEMNNFVKAQGNLEPQSTILKLRVLAALDYGNMVTEEEMTEFINLIQPKSPEADAVWDRKVNEKIFEKLGVEYDEALAKKLDLLKCRYLSHMLVSSEDFFKNMKILVEHIKNNPDKTITETFNSLEQNLETRRQYEALGVDYDKWVNVDKNSYVAIEVELDAEEKKQSAIRNLEQDFNDPQFRDLPGEIQDGILEALKEIGVTLEKSYEENWEGDGEAHGTREYYRLYKNGERIKFEDLDKIMSTIRHELNRKEFWSKTNSDDTVESARAHLKNHLLKLRKDDISQAKNIKSGEVAQIEVRKTDMNDVKKSIGLGNDGQCCTGLGKNFNEWSAPTYVMNKCIGAIEVVDGDTFCGNTMIYLAYVDGEPALVMDNIELKTKYHYNDKIRDAILEYAKKLCVEIGKPDLPIYAGPHRHKLTMNVYPKATHTMQVIGNTGNDKIYLDYDISAHKIDGTETATIEMYRLR